MQVCDGSVAMTKHTNVMTSHTLYVEMHNMYFFQLKSVTDNDLLLTADADKITSTFLYFEEGVHNLSFLHS